MAEELKKEEVVEEQIEVSEDKKVENQEEKKIEFSEIELKAMKMGWRPKEDFDDEEDFVDAEEFVKRKPLFDANARLKSELKDVKKALRELANFQLKIREDERKSVLAELRNQKKQALEEGNAEKLIEIDEQIADVRAEEIAQKNQPRVQQGPHPNFVSWVEKNPWYAQDAELRAEADAIGVSYAASHPGIEPEEVLKIVSARVRKMYPEKFQNPNRSRPSAVEGSSNAKSGSKKEVDSYELTEDERRVMNTFVRAGVMSKEDYIAELKKIKGV